MGTFLGREVFFDGLFWVNLCVEDSLEGIFWSFFFEKVDVDVPALETIHPSILLSFETTPLKTNTYPAKNHGWSRYTISFSKMVLFVGDEFVGFSGL